MKVEIFNTVPPSAASIRQEVFVKEQGFEDEFDATDSVAVHFVLFDGAMPIATCRVFEHTEKNVYVLGRLAVVKERRGCGTGSLLLKKAEEYAASVGGKEIRLHAQCRAASFYEKSGFLPFGEIEDEQGCPHVWMKKTLY